MICTPERDHLDSWFDPIGARRRAAALSAALRQRLTGVKALFITLTFDRSKFDGPENLFEFAQDKQLLPLFMRRLSAHLRKKLTGLWLRKMEFQRGGWLHYHILLLVPHFIDSADLAALWRWGFVSVRRVKSVSAVASYAGKCSLTGYISKSSSLPPFLLERPSRSVKIISTSPGFWSRDGRVESKESSRQTELPDDGVGRRLDAWVPLRVRLRQANGGTRLHLERFGKKTVRRIAADPLCVMAALDVIDPEWSRFDGLVRWDQPISSFVAFLSDLSKAAAEAGGAGLGPAPPFNLIHPCNPDKTPPDHTLDQEIWEAQQESEYRP